MLLTAIGITILISIIGDAANVCRVNKISLQQMASTTFVDGTTAYTIGFCNGATQPSSTSLTACGTAGYITVHNTAAAGGACVQSYPNVVTDVAEGIGNVTYTVGSADGTKRAKVMVVCDSTLSDLTTSRLDTPVSSSISGSITTLSFVTYSKSACPVSNYFCSGSQFCSDATKSCIEGVCVDASCVTMSLESNNASRSFVSKSPANFLSQFAMSDCHGTPVPSLNRSYFNITVQGKSLDDPSLVDESDFLFLGSPEDFAAPATRPQITTLVLDQSQSVRVNYEDTLKAAAITLVTRLMSTLNATSGLRVARDNNYVAVILIDGSINPYILQTHTTDMSTVLAALNRLPVATPDQQSTNLYGGIVSGLQQAYKMKLQLRQNTASANTLFDNSTNIFSSMILFTDGFDTSSRLSRQSALNEAIDVGSEVAVLTVGIANTSDTALLQSISTTGYATSVGNDTSTIAEAFDEIALRLELLSQNHYRFMFCVPFRNAGAEVVIALNRTTFPLSTSVDVAAKQTLTMTFDATSFGSGCTTAGLQADAVTYFDVVSNSTTATSNSTLFSFVSLAQESTLSYSIVAKGAFFFQFNMPVATSSRQFVGMGMGDGEQVRNSFHAQAEGSQLLLVSPSPTTVFYLNSTEVAASNGVYTFRCVLSEYCYDGIFTSTFRPEANRQYRAMAINPSTTASLSFTVTARAYSPTTTTTTATTSTGTTTSAPLGSSTPQYDSRLSFGGDVDEPAAIIFFIFAVVFFIIMLVFVICRCCANEIEEDGARQRTQQKAPAAIMLQHGDAPLLLRQESEGRSPRSVPREPPRSLPTQRAYAAQGPYYTSPPRHTQLTIDRSPDSFDSIPDGNRYNMGAQHSPMERERSNPRTEVKDRPAGDYHPDLLL